MTTLRVINRSAIVVVPLQPFLDWLYRVDLTSAALTLEDIRQDPTIYLIPDGESDDAASKYVRKIYRQIFEEQLEGWHRDRSAWPARRSFDMFTQWFDYRINSMLVDLCDDPLIREDL